MWVEYRMANRESNCQEVYREVIIEQTASFSAERRKVNALEMN